MTCFRLTAIGLALSITSNARADLRTFDVDPQYQQEVFAALTDVLTPDPQRGLIMEAHGRVELLPSGQILVNASAETLEQVEQVLQAIRDRAVAAPPRVELRYWAVLGRRTSGNDSPGSPPPSALTDVLAELERLHGELQFRVMGTASLTTESGQRGNVDGMSLNIEQTAFVQGDMLNATIDMELNSRISNPQVTMNQFLTTVPSRNAGVTVRSSLRRGEFVVVGQSELIGGGLDGPIFFIVHWPEA